MEGDKIIQLGKVSISLDEALADAHDMLPRLPEMEYSEPEDKKSKRFVSEILGQRSLSVMLLEYPRNHPYRNRFREHDRLRIVSGNGTGRDVAILTLSHLGALQIDTLARVYFERYNLITLPLKQYRGRVIFPIKGKENDFELDEDNIVWPRNRSPFPGLSWASNEIRDRITFKPIAKYIFPGFPLTNGYGS